MCSCYSVLRDWLLGRRIEASLVEAFLRFGVGVDARSCGRRPRCHYAPRGTSRTLQVFGARDVLGCSGRSGAPKKAACVTHREALRVNAGARHGAGVALCVRFFARHDGRLAQLWRQSADILRDKATLGRFFCLLALRPCTALLRALSCPQPPFREVAINIPTKALRPGVPQRANTVRQTPAPAPRRLPPELWSETFSYLDDRSLFSASMASKLHRAVALAPPLTLRRYALARGLEQTSLRGLAAPEAEEAAQAEILTYVRGSAPKFAARDLLSVCREILGAMAGKSEAQQTFYFASLTPPLLAVLQTQVPELNEVRSRDMGAYPSQLYLISADVQFSRQCNLPELTQQLDIALMLASPQRRLFERA